MPTFASECNMFPSMWLHHHLHYRGIHCQTHLHYNPNKPNFPSKACILTLTGPSSQHSHLHYTLDTSCLQIIGHHHFILDHTGLWPDSYMSGQGSSLHSSTIHPWHHWPLIQTLWVKLKVIFSTPSTPPAFDLTLMGTDKILNKKKVKTALMILRKSTFTLNQSSWRFPVHLIWVEHTPLHMYI